jgi:hypothetical protein
MKNFKLLLIGIGTFIGLLTPALASAQGTTTAAELPQAQHKKSAIALQQSPADLERQREAERILKEAERVRQENRSRGTDDNYVSPPNNNLQRRTDDAVDRLRGSFGNEQQLRESQVEVERLRQERIRLDREYREYPYFYPGPNPYYNSPQLPSTQPYPTPSTLGTLPESPTTQVEIYPNTQPEVLPVNPGNQYAPEFVTPKNLDLGTASVSVGFKDGIVNPAIGYRFAGSPIAIEVGTVLNQDSLPAGQLNDYSVPGSLLQQFPTGFNDLGSKTISPQIGADLLGYYNVSSTVALYGGVGLYFQGRSTIFQSKATTDLFKQTNTTDVNVAVSGGADVRLGDSWRLGGGYHSLRGVTAKIGYDF